MIADGDTVRRESFRPGNCGGVAAETVPVDDIGTLTIGNYADIVAFEDSPLEDISNLYEPAAVYKGGQKV